MDRKAVLLFIALGFNIFGTNEGQLQVDYSVTACDSEMAPLMCPTGHEIIIESAFFGRNDRTTCTNTIKDTTTMCSLPDATARVRRMCEGKDKCKVEASAMAMGTPQPCTVRSASYLTVNYNCQRRMYSTLMCESATATLKCPAGLVIQAEGAFYGREDLDINSCPHSTVPTNVARCETNNALTVFKGMCDGKRGCNVQPSVANFGDPCPGVYKYLKVNYTCVECANLHVSDPECDFWSALGFCKNNSNWMLDNCRQSCTKCNDKEPACMNEDSDSYCEAVAERGECDNNPAYMLAFCRKTCTGCDKKACVNRETNGNCRFWGQPECEANPGFMLSMCTETCFGCDNAAIPKVAGSIPCRNALGDQECSTRETNGECTSNPALMTNCTKSCLGCVNDILCENRYGNDTLCDQYAAEGECTTNPGWMFRYCWKSCTGCAGEKECSNKHTNDAECEWWRGEGECDTNAAYMTDACYKACSGCDPSPPACVNANGNDADCEFWEAQGLCYTNPTYMNAFCRKSCTRCDMTSTLAGSMIGSPLTPGMAASFSMGNEMALQEITTDATLTHFTGFFVDTIPVKLMIFRPDNPFTGVFSIIYEREVTPMSGNSAQTFPVPENECVQLRAGDRVGFASASIRSMAPVAYYMDWSAVSSTTYVRSITSPLTSTFTAANLPFRFSITASYDTFGSCSS